MFDGNFRVRKEVNLSGRRKQTSENKVALLRNAEAQRVQRLEQQRRTQAACLLQRWTRGCLTRLHLLADWVPTAHKSLRVTCHCIYYFRNWLWKHSTSVRKLLILFEHECHTLSCTITPCNNLDHDRNRDRDRDRDTMDVGSHHESNARLDDTSWCSQKRILHVTLQELSSDLDDTQLQALVTLLQTYWPLLLRKKVPDESLFLDLAACLSRWIHTTDPFSSSWQSNFVKTLCQWAIQTSQALSNPCAQGLVASILLATSTQVASLLPGDLCTNWLLPLEQTLNTNVAHDDIQKATQDIVQHGNDVKILSNLLQTDSPLFSKASQQLPHAILPLLTQVLRRGGELRLMVSLLIRGDTLDVVTTIENEQTTTMEVADMVDSDEEDSNEDEGTNNDQPSTGTSKRMKSTSRLARKDLLTVSKLDKVYQDSVIQQIRDCDALVSRTRVKPSAASTLEMAKTLARAPWLAWGLTLFDKDNGKLLVDLLGQFMQSTTSLRPNTKVGILSPLAFHKPFMLKLWNYAVHTTMKESEKDLALAVFCDLFAHYLVALSDVDFLQCHTSGNTSQGVMATDVISIIRTKLYELYWIQPVVVSEVSAQLPRARMLLAGTKVWNSMHERWNRLVRKNSFCEESMWWFPHLASRDGDGAIVSSRERQETHHDNDSADMDLDDDYSEEEGQQPMSAAEVETDALAHAFQDPKMARLLTSIPQALPFGQRVKLFHSLLKNDKRKISRSRRQTFFDDIVRERIRIRRSKLYKDSMQQLNELGSRLKHRVQVSFVNQHGIEEAGIDGGGVFKEFLDDLIKDGFASSTTKIKKTSNVGAPPLFSVTPQQTLAVNFDIADDAEMLVHYEFLGRVLGKAVYESILVEPQFCLPFLNQLLGKTNSVDDLMNYDEEYYNNLNKLKSLNDEEVEALGLTFEVTVGGRTSTGSPKTVELIPRGRLIPVKTKAHVFQYIYAVANQLLNIQGARQTKSFLRGFRDLIPASWVRLFSANELQNLISGDDSVRGIDVPSLMRSMNYLGGYHPSQPYIQDFWNIIENDLTPEQQRKFLRFMTSCSRQPLLGFGSLEPSPSIQQIRLEDDEPSKNSKLPTSQTCFNLLKLPNYKSKALLKEKLLAAIESGAGFELT